MIFNIYLAKELVAEVLSTHTTYIFKAGIGRLASCWLLVASISYQTNPILDLSFYF